MDATIRSHTLSKTDFIEIELEQRPFSCVFCLECDWSVKFDTTAQMERRKALRQARSHAAKALWNEHFLLFPPEGPPAGFGVDRQHELSQRMSDCINGNDMEGWKVTSIRLKHLEAVIERLKAEWDKRLREAKKVEASGTVFLEEEFMPWDDPREIWNKLLAFRCTACGYADEFWPQDPNDRKLALYAASEHARIAHPERAKSSSIGGIGVFLPSSFRQIWHLHTLYMTPSEDERLWSIYLSESWYQSSVLKGAYLVNYLRWAIRETWPVPYYSV